jgi:hypothetical protein
MRTDYLLKNADDRENITLVSVKQQKNNLTINEIYAVLVFKVNSHSELEVIAFCGNANNTTTKGHGTKLLNLLKQTMSLMHIDNLGK